MNWSVKKSHALYHIDTWSEGYVDINTKGNVTVKPTRNHNKIDLLELTRELRAKALNLPILVRFSDILKDRVNTLINAFEAAMQSKQYTANYTAVYPIKVNQQRRVIEDIVAAGNGKVGLEAGSKPELLIVIALAKPGSTIICNGYKDREYIRLALIAKVLGLNTYIVIEKLSEINLIVECANELNITPQLGLRIRLSSIAKGNWQNTGGEKSKFGLHANQILEAIGIVKQNGLLESLNLLHFHIGSQVTELNDFKAGLNEGARYYAELIKHAVPIDTLDIGGGLGVDYEGTQSNRLYSMDYTIDNYANTVIDTIQSICKTEQINTPAIITESGRAMTAHHAMLITNVIDIEEPVHFTSEKSQFAKNDIIKKLSALLETTPTKEYDERYKYFSNLYETARLEFAKGKMDLAQWALVEELYYVNCQSLLNAIDGHHALLDTLRDKLADKYFCNFSLFQTMPDTWAIDQIFPILPLQRLTEKPKRRCTLQDLTCDSDGRIDYYVDGEGIETSLPIHHIKKDEEYLIGIFLLGAYQEILGDIHNLFGDTASVNITLNDNGEIEIDEIDFGDKVSDLFPSIHIDLETLQQRYNDLVEKSKLDPDIQNQYLQHFIDGLDGYTYLED